MKIVPDPVFSMPYSSPQLTAAPMEGLTTVVFRRLHAEMFGAADRYYLPFVTPTVEPRFTARQLRELAPRANEGLAVIPQLLTRRSADFLWAARALADMGYPEVNLNLGCPAGTVVVKGKGSGFLGDAIALREFFDDVFGQDLPIAVSVKTRLGLRNPDEFAGIVELYNLYPIARLIVHPRIRSDFYKGDARRSVLLSALPSIKAPLGVNGDIVTEGDIAAAGNAFAAAPGGLAEIMIGRALMADPALLRKARGGPAASRGEIRSFHHALFDAYTTLFESRKNAMMRLKEYWFYQSCLFGADDELEKLHRAMKAVNRTREPAEFNARIEDLIESFTLLQHARFGWRKPL